MKLLKGRENVEMEIIIAVSIAVLGWIATHLLTIRAQNKTFINQVVNDARLDVTKAIRNYQDWLGKVYVSISGLSQAVITQKMGFSVDWYSKATELTNLYFSDRRATEWVFRLEEYEILFPKTAECRRQLVDRQSPITKRLGSLVEELLIENLERRRKAIRDAQADAEIFMDQGALMEDLRIYLQNLCLSSFTGNRTPERKPEDLSLPRLVEDDAGNLRIVTMKKKKSTDVKESKTKKP